MKLKIKSTATNSRMRTIQACFTSVLMLMLCLVISGCPDDHGETSGDIQYNSVVYTVNIGKIGNDNSGNICIELEGSNLPGQTRVVQGKIVPYIGMRIVVDGRTIEYDFVFVQTGLYEYYFNTAKNPEKIIVYSNDGSNSTLTFHGKRKTVIK